MTWAETCSRGGYCHWGCQQFSQYLVTHLRHFSSGSLYIINFLNRIYNIHPCRALLQHCSRLLVPASNLSLDWTAVMNFFHLLLDSIIWKGIQCTVHAPYSKPIMILGFEIYTFEDTGHGHTWAKDIYRSRFWLYDMIWSYGLLMTGCQCYQSLNKLNCFEFWATRVCPGCRMPRSILVGAMV